jgi:hypothetical protein
VSNPSGTPGPLLADLDLMLATNQFARRHRHVD